MLEVSSSMGHAVCSMGRLPAAHAPRRMLLAVGACAERVHKLGLACARAWGLIARFVSNPHALGISTHFCTQRFPILSDLLPTSNAAFLSLLPRYFSPLSTGPIKTTTKYISTIGVSL